VGETGLKNKMNWTQITSIDGYKKAILAIKEVSGLRDLSDWELDVFSLKHT